MVASRPGRSLASREHAKEGEIKTHQDVGLPSERKTIDANFRAPLKYFFNCRVRKGSSQFLYLGPGESRVAWCYRRVMQLEFADGDLKLHPAQWKRAASRAYPRCNPTSVWC